MLTIYDKSIIIMEIRKKTIGINFPFQDSNNGDFLNLTEIPETEIKANLIHLLLTKKGSRYYLPEFGTNLYQYIFEPLDEGVKTKIEDEIMDSCDRFLPNLKVNKINIEQFFDNIQYVADEEAQHRVKINIDYTITSRSFQSSDSISLTF